MKTRYGALALAIACLAPAAAQAGMHKCVIEGKIGYQELPCPGELGSAGGDATRPPVPATGATPASRPDTAALERKLDRLQGRGKGMLQKQPPGPVETPPREEPWRWQPPVPREVEAARIAAMHHANTIRKNAESAASLNRMFADAEKKCGGRLPDYPTVGMSDEFFRACTVQGLIGGVIQVVAVNEGKVPLRLYVYPSERASRVYSVGGIVTKILP